MDEWLVCSMADNDTFEWIDVLTGDVLAGDGSVQRSQPAHVLLPDPLTTASWRVPIECAVRSVGRCDWVVGVERACVLVRGCSLCRVWDPVRDCGVARARCAARRVEGTGRNRWRTGYLVLHMWYFSIIQHYIY